MINLAVIGEKLPYNSTIAIEKQNQREAIDIISSPAEAAWQILIRSFSRTGIRVAEAEPNIQLMK